MIFATFRRWFNRPKSSNRRSADGTESMFVVPAVAGAAVHPTENDTDDNSEAVEGNSVDTNSSEDASTGDATCGASCGATL